MDRFVVVSVAEAIERKYPGWEDFQRYQDYFWCLYETDGEKPTRLVFSDGGEPEDQSLVRDWSWVPEELNRLSEELRILKEHFHGEKTSSREYDPTQS